MKNFIEVQVANNTVTIAVSNIVSVCKHPSEGINSVLTLNTSAYIGPNNLSAVLYLDLEYQEVLALIEQAYY